MRKGRRRRDIISQRKALLEIGSHWRSKVLYSGKIEGLIYAIVYILEGTVPRSLGNRKKKIFSYIKESFRKYRN